MEVNRDPLNLRLWKEIDGDHNLALDWPIDHTSIVWEIGGFEGRWAAQMVEKFDPVLYVFEPQMWAYHLLQERFENNPKVKVHHFGLWTHSARLILWEHDTDGASLVKQTGRTKEYGEFRDIYPFDVVVDVCLMNIEGGEYVLLPYLIGLDQMRRFRYFWCQFHPGVVDNGEEKTGQIYKGLARTHRILWDFYPTAVAWELK